MNRYLGRLPARSEHGRVSVLARVHTDEQSLAAWDRLVDGTPYSDVAQLASWGELRRRVGFEPLHVLAYRDEHLVGGAQLLCRRVPVLGTLAYIPYGPLIDPNASDREEICHAIGAVLEELARRHLTCLFVQPPDGAHDVSGVLLRRGFRRSDAGIAPASSLRIDLDADEEDLRRGLTKTLRNWSRRWPKENLTVRTGDERDIPLLAELLAQSAEHQNFRPLPVDYLEALYRHLQPSGHVMLFVAELASAPVAVILTTSCGGVVKVRLTGMARSPEATRLKAPAAVRWEAIRWAKSQGYRYFDLGGIGERAMCALSTGQSLDSEEITGYERFKAQFGGAPFRYPPAVELFSSSAVRLGYDLARRWPVGRRLTARVEQVMRGQRAKADGERRIQSPIGEDVVRQIFHHVVKPPYVWLRNAAVDVLFERRYGVRTAGRIDLAELGLASEERKDYKPAGWLSLRRILPRREVSANDVFIDFGSGKGRAVIEAARYPFRRVIGVELSEVLHDIARKNIESSASRLQCQDVLLVHSDVLDYSIPDDVTVVFLNNPFRGATFAEVINRLLASVDHNPRELRIIYGNPIEEPFLLSTGRIHPVRTARGLRPTSEWSRSNSIRLYRVTPSAASRVAGSGQA